VHQARELSYPTTEIVGQDARQQAFSLRKSSSFSKHKKSLSKKKKKISFYHRQFFRQKKLQPFTK